jgi:hypothetical protein
MADLSAYGRAVVTPSGWEGRIFRRAEAGEVNVEVTGAAAPDGETSFPVAHVATIALPLDMADCGSDVVEDLGRNDALIVLKEFDPADVEQPLFERDGMRRRLRTDSFDPAVLQRRLEGQTGSRSSSTTPGERSACTSCSATTSAARRWCRASTPSSRPS